MNNIVRNNIYALKKLSPQKITHSFVIDADLQKIMPYQFYEAKSGPRSVYDLTWIRICY